MATTRATMTGAAPDQNVDPWGWTQWAATQDPKTYDLNKYEITNGNLDAFKPQLQAAGLWKPEWDVGPGGEYDGGDSGTYRPVNNRDLSSLAGYKVSATRGPGRGNFTALWNPDGTQAGNATYNRDDGSMHGKDWATAASVIGGAYLGATSAFGAGGAAGGTTANAIAQGAVQGGVTGAGVGGAGAAGATGVGTGAVALADAGGGTVSDAGTGGGKVATTPTSSTGGYWNGTDFSGTAPQAGSSNLGTAATTGAKGMTTADWLNAGLTAYSIANQPKAPDTSGINAAAASSAQLSKDAFDWFKGEFERTQGQRDEAAARDGKIADAQLEGMNFATQQAKDLATRNKTVFQPVEDKIVSESMNFDTPARRAQAVAEATADVEGAAGRAQQANNRAMMRAGVTLDSPAAAALAQDASLAKAKMVAGATGAATRNVEQQGWARINDAAALGKGIVGNQATQQQIATNAGGASVNAGAGGINAAQAGTGIMQTGFNTAQQGLQTAGSLYGQAGSLTSATRGQDLNFLGNAFNSYMRSSKKVKKGTGNVTDGSKELAEVMATPVEEGWQYDTTKGGPDDGGQVHTGPMAETVRAKMGDEVAPGGEVIDMRQMGGKLMAAVQAVTRDVAEMRDQMAARARMGKKPATQEA